MIYETMSPHPQEISASAGIYRAGREWRLECNLASYLALMLESLALVR
jgi:hypothetical protein